MALEVSFGIIIIPAFVPAVNGEFNKDLKKRPQSRTF